jgi:hypothetical protein
MRTAICCKFHDVDTAPLCKQLRSFRIKFLDAGKWSPYCTPVHNLCAVECLVMLIIAAFVILAVAVLLGSVLAVLHLQTEGSTPPWSLAALHGLLAIGGLICLALALRGPPRGLDQGVASFGIIATLLITLAALIGVALLAKRIFKTRIAGIMIGIHATLAVSGFVILAAYVLVG